MTQIADYQQTAGDSLIKLNLQLKTGQRERSFDLYPEFEKLLRGVSDEMGFPLAAFSDETVLEGVVPSRQRWAGGQSGLLSSKLFNIDTPGEMFCLRLDELLKSPGNAVVVQVYYMCLLCGFKGGYLDDNERRVGAINKAADYLRAEGRLPESFLPPHAEEASSVPRRPESQGWQRWENLNKWWLLLWVLALLILKATLILVYVRPALKGLVR